MALTGLSIRHRLPAHFAKPFSPIFFCKDHRHSVMYWSRQIVRFGHDDRARRNDFPSWTLPLFPWASLFGQSAGCLLIDRAIYDGRRTLDLKEEQLSDPLRWTGWISAQS